MASAEQKIRRARLNGVDDSGIYYNEAIVLAMRDQTDQAMAKLQEAFNRGFREQWVMDIDGRLAPLRDRPEFLLLMDQIREDINSARAEIKALSLASL